MIDIQLTEQEFLELFGEKETDFDIYGGTVKLENQERQVFISSETLYGLYKALSDETGDAWKIVLKNCGYLWGKRVISRIDREISARMQSSLHELSVNNFVELIKAYFAYHGWGILDIDLAHAEKSGLIRAQLKNSIITQALKEASGPVDYMISGMLRAIFEAVAGRELDCIQISSSQTSSGSMCEFLISATPRIESVEPMAGHGTVDDAIRELQAA